MMDNNEIFCKIFQKDITEEGYIYFPGREDAWSNAPLSSKKIILNAMRA